MGGNNFASNSKKRKEKVSYESSTCQQCNMDTHKADTCPFTYSACKKEACEGIRKIMTSNTKENPGRKFLICQFSKCRSFQWLDEAINDVKISKEIPKQHVVEGCFECGAKGHWESDYPWTKVKCKNGCAGYKISTKKATDGWKFLKCSSCKHFEWLAEAINEAEPGKCETEDLFSKLCLGSCTYLWI